MVTNVNPRITRAAPADGNAPAPSSLNETLRLKLKKKKNRMADVPESLLQQLVTHRAPRLDAAIAPATAADDAALTATERDALRPGQRQTLPAQLAPARTALLPLTRPVSAAIVTPPAQPPLAPVKDNGLAAIHATGDAAAGALHARPAVTLADGAPRVALPSITARKPHWPGEEGAALANAPAAVATQAGGEASLKTADDAGFTPPDALNNALAEQADSASGMKLSYQFLRWGSGRVDISAQPHQLLFQPSTEMVRERLGESLLARSQSPAWQMDEHPDRRQQQQHRQNDEEES